MTTKTELKHAFMGRATSKDKIRNFNISVEEIHIQRAKPNTQAWCMVALAIRDCIDGAHTVRVDTSFIRFSIGDTKSGGMRYAFPTPTKVMKPIQEFDSLDDSVDRTEIIKPFKFQLSAVCGYINPMIGRVSDKPPPRSPPSNKDCPKRYRWNGAPVLMGTK